MKRSTGGSLKPPTELTTGSATSSRTPGQDAGEVAGLLLAEEDPDDVRRLVLQRRLVDVDDREAGVREALGSRVDGVALREPDADDEIEAVPGQRRVVGT